MLQVRIGASTWNVRRRFKDFDVLYANLCAAYGKAIVPPVPPKQLLKNESSEFLQRRAQLLSAFLEGVLADKVLSMSAEVCAFLECEAGSALTKANVEIASCTAMLVTELATAERTTAQAAAALERAALEASVLRAKLQTAISERDANAMSRDANARARDRNARALDEVTADATNLRAEVTALRDQLRTGRERALARVWKGRQHRQVRQALQLWIAGTPKKPALVQPVADKLNPLTAALTAAIANIEAAIEKPSTATAVAAAPVPSSSHPVDTRGSQKPSAEADTNCAELLPPPLTPVGATASVAKQRPNTASVAPPLSAPTEHAVKSGLLLKQGAGNRTFKERYFELVSLGEGGQYGAFLVYYESELKKSVKGYISLDGASVSTIEHETEPYTLSLTTPARRLSVLTPGVSPGPLKKAGGIDGFLAGFGKGGNDENAHANGPSTPDQPQSQEKAAVYYDCPPSLEAKMSVMQKLDNWGRHALRNAMAQGPMNAPYTTWTLAALSSAELQSWLASFTSVLGAPDAAAAKTPTGANGYQPVGQGRSVTSRTPVVLGAHAEEVM